MKVSTIIARFLAIGGGFWMLILGSSILGEIFGDFGAAFMLTFVWGPGILAWICWILKSFKKTIFGMEELPWLVAIVVNLGYVVIMFPPWTINFSKLLQFIPHLWLLTGFSLSLIALLIEISEKKEKGTSETSANLA